MKIIGSNFCVTVVGRHADARFDENAMTNTFLRRHANQHGF